MTSWDLRNIHATRNGCWDTLPCGTWHWNYTCWCKTSWLPLPRLASLISGYIQYLPRPLPPATYTHIIMVPLIFKNHRQKNTFRHNFPKKNLFYPLHLNILSYKNETDRVSFMLNALNLSYSFILNSTWYQL